MAYNKFVELVDSKITFELFDKNGKKRKLPVKLRPETPGSELWLRITSPEEFRSLYPAPRWSDAERLDDELHVAVHVSAPILSSVKKYSEIGKRIINHYINKGKWHKIVEILDIKPSEANKLSVYKIAYLIEVHLKELVTFDFTTKEIKYTPIILKTKKEYEKFSKLELIEECKMFNLSIVGNKAELINYLSEEITKVSKNVIDESDIPTKKAEKKSISIYKSMSKSELIKECKLLGLALTGEKADLLTRILEN